MEIKSSDITILFQGPIDLSDTIKLGKFKSTLDKIRNALLGCKIVLSTWENTYIPKEIYLDKVVYNKDPGGLIGIKRSEINKPNNINRQIVSTYNGLMSINTIYTVKLRTDCQLDNFGFIDYFTRYYNDNRIVVCSFFTIDPTIYEHMPFHVSDWFQFGKTSILRRYWDVDIMRSSDAAWYLDHKYSRGSGYYDKQFISKWAVEQYLAINYAKKLGGYVLPEFHNDCRKDVMQSHFEFFAKNLIVLEPHQIGLVFPKYQAVNNAIFSSISCILFLDWYNIYISFYGLNVKDDMRSQVNKRALIKRIVRIVTYIINPISDFWYPSTIRKVLIMVLKKIVYIKSLLGK